MDKRRYFLIGDVASNAIVALLAAVAADSFFSASWPMPVAMVVGMILGMAIANLCCVICLMRFFGAMEVMLPTMLSGMFVGMVVAMSRTMTPLALFDHLLLALVIALLTTVTVWAASERLRGEQLAPGIGEHD